jgi:hypothetical protein
VLIRLLPIAVIIFSLVNIAHADLSPTDRYDSGYNHGWTDETNGASCYCNSQDHTYTFCRGYNAGWYAAAAQTNNNNSSLVQTNNDALNQSSSSQQQSEQPQSTPLQQAPSQNSTVTP